MSWGRFTRLAIVAAILVAGFYWIHRTSLDATRVNLYVAAVIGAVTIVYALLTYEMLLQNQAMAQAAVDATKLTERGLRFSYTQNLVYRTLNTKDPFFRSTPGITAVDNADYRRAIANYDDAQAQQTEFVFAVVKNVGRGAATNLNMEAEYDITDSSSVAKEYSVAKNASVQILEPDMGVALCIFFSKIPTRDDRVSLVSAIIYDQQFLSRCP